MHFNLRSKDLTFNIVIRFAIPLFILVQNANR